MLASIAFAAEAGEVADRARDAERALAAGDGQAAIEAFDLGADAFWDALPLGFRDVAFAEQGSVEAFGTYSAAASEFDAGSAATIYLEPVGYAYMPAGRHHRVTMTVGLEIRSPGGIVFADAPQFGRLDWSGLARSREIHGAVTVKLPDLKRGSYRMVVSLKDRVSGEETETVLPFEIRATP